MGQLRCLGLTPSRLLTYACAAVGLYCMIWHQLGGSAGVAYLRRLRRSVEGIGRTADLSLLARGSCVGRHLFATVPRHGLGNKLTWVGTAVVAAMTYDRCLRLISEDAEGFEDWGLIPSALPSSSIEFVAATPAGLPRLALLPDARGPSTFAADVFGGDGYDCRLVSTNCHALSEGVIRDAFFAQAGDLDLGKSWHALRPQRISLPAFDATFTRFLSSFELAPHLARLAEAAIARCRAISSSGFIIGAHYRAGDSCDAQYANATLKRCAPLDHIITEVARAAGAHPGSAIFLASDSAEALTKVQSALPKLSFCSSGSDEGAVDLQLLSRMHLIVGSRYSSFSHVAAKWAGVSLVEAG